MKWIGMLLIMVSAAETGCYAASRLRTQADQLRLLRQMILAMMSELKHTLPLVPDLLRSLAAENEYQSLEFLQYAAQNAERFPECWTEALKTDNALSDNVRSILQTVGNTLGSTTLEGQLSALELCAEQIEKLQETHEEQVKQRGKLYQSCGILGGIFLVILFI